MKVDAAFVAAGDELEQHAFVLPGCLAVVGDLAVQAKEQAKARAHVLKPDRDPAPAGENLSKDNVVDVNKLPDNYSKRDAGTDAERDD